MVSTSKSDKALAAGMSSKGTSKRIDDVMDNTLIGRAAAVVEPTRMVLIASLRPSPFQSRGEIDEAHISELMESIKQEGILTPLLVRPIETEESERYTITPPIDPTYELIAGHNRLEALRRLGKDRAPVIVRRLDDQEAARALTADNAMHKALTDWELYKHMVMLEKTGAAKSNAELGRVFSFSRTKVVFLKAFASLPKSLHSLLDKYPSLIGYNLMHGLQPYLHVQDEAQKARHVEAIETAIHRLADGKLTQAGALGWVKKQIEEAQPVYRREVALEGARAVYTDREARIVSDTIDFDRLHELIAANLDSLRKKSS